MPPRIHLRTLIALGASVLGACRLDLSTPADTALHCAVDAQCPRGRVCVRGAEVCLPSGAACTEGGTNGVAAVIDGTACDSDGAPGVCVRAVCRPSRCGDGFVDAAVGETCEPGVNQTGTPNEGCRADCSRCGDGVLDAPIEDCDDGNDSNFDACKNDCTFNVCGDGFVNAGVEGCDGGADERANPNDGCDQCQPTHWSAEIMTGLGEGGGDPLQRGFLIAGVAVGARGELYVGSDGSRIWRIDVDESGTRRTTLIAGSGAVCAAGSDCGEGDLATSAPVALDNTGMRTSAIVLDGTRTLYFSDTENHRVRKIDLRSGVLTTVAGNGQICAVMTDPCGDGGPALAAALTYPRALALASDRKLYVSSFGTATTSTDAGAKIRVIDLGVNPPTIALVAGDGTACPTPPCTTATVTPPCSSAGPVAAASASLAQPVALALAKDGTLYVADSMAQRVCALRNGNLELVAGTGIACAPTTAACGDGGSAPLARMSAPAGLALEAGDAGLVIADGTNRLRRVDLALGTIATIAGTGDVGFSGDGGPALAAHLRRPRGLTTASDGSLYSIDTGGVRLRHLAGGILTTVLGNGRRGFDGDGGPAAAARLDPAQMTTEGSTVIWLADRRNHAVRKIDLATGLITSVAGTGSPEYSGDGGNALQADLSSPGGIARATNGDLYVSDKGNQRIRKIVLGTPSIITTVAGNGIAASIDHVDGTLGSVSAPSGLAIGPDGALYIAEFSYSRIRRLDLASGALSTVAGSLGYCTPALMPCGDGGPALSARLSLPIALAFGTDARLYVIETPASGASPSAARIRVLTPDAFGNYANSSITTFAGDGVLCATAGAACGDGGLATAAQFRTLQNLAFDAAGNAWVTDLGNFRVRRIGAADGIITSPIGATPSSALEAGDGGPLTGVAMLGPVAIAWLAGALYVSDSDTGASIVRRLDLSANVADSVAGYRFFGEREFAGGALRNPWALTFAPRHDSWLVADNANLHRLDLATKQVIEVTGYNNGLDDSNNPTRSARFSRTLADARGVAWDATRSLIYVSERDHHTLRVVHASPTVDPLSWTVELFSGSVDVAGFADGPATSALFSAPEGLLFDALRQRLYVADAGNHVVRVIDVTVTPADVSVLAGTPALAGDSTATTTAVDVLLDSPSALAVADNGTLYIADTGNNRVRRALPDAGRIGGASVVEIVIGDGSPSSGGSGLPAYAFPVDAPRGLALDVYGNLFIASHQTVKVVVAKKGALAGPSDEVTTIYGAAPRTQFPEVATNCLSGIALNPDATRGDSISLLDACQGFWLRVKRTAAAGPP